MLRIALAQINPIVGDLYGNREKITEYIAKARRLGVNVIVFPELAITGYPPEDLLLKPHFVNDNLKVLKSLTRDTAHITAIIGFVDKDSRGRLFNAAAVIHKKQIKGVYRKRELPNYGVFDEKRYFTQGDENQIFTIGKTVFGVSICEDIWKKEGPCSKQAWAGAHILINLSSSPYYSGKRKQREKVIVERAKQSKVFVCYVNLIGGQDELIFDGASMIVNPKGEIIASGKQFEEDLVIADIQIDLKSRVVKKGDLKKISVAKDIKTKGKIHIKGKKTKQLSPIEEIYEALVLGVRDYVLKNGFDKVVIGLSGGIDSSLVAAIACEAIGKDNVAGISMPSRYTSAQTRSDVGVLARNLDIKLIEVSIEPVYSSYLKILKKGFIGLKPDVTEENLQARIRGNILMAFSNKFGWLVLTTGNKSEIAVGYCTLYGDMAGGFAVIKDIPKTLVYELARFINDNQEKELIPGSILKRAPTAELRKGQKDEDSLPPYDILDPILEAYVELDKSLGRIKEKINNQKLIKEVANMVDRMEYKRRQAPPGIKITPKAFGRDRRLPITNRYKEK